MQLDPIYVVANLKRTGHPENPGKPEPGAAEPRRSCVKVPIEVGLQDESTFSRRGTLEYVSPGIDPATGTMLVRGVLANPNRDLLPGFFVRIRLPMESGARNALACAGPGAAGRPGRPLPARRQQQQHCRKTLCSARRDVRRPARDHFGPEAPTIGSIVGELWRTSPGGKVVPQLTAIAAPGTPQ